MANQLITLRPTRGAELDVDGTTYHLGLDTDWGEASVDSSLLEGPDITGAVAGTRRLLTRERSLVIQVRAATGSAYLTAAEALVACVSNIQRYGGVIVRQLDLGGAGYSEALECEILEASLSEAEDGWLEATRLHGEVVLNLTTQPQWLADWEEVADVDDSTDSLIECPVDALRGNLPGPGRIVLADKAGYREMVVADGPSLYWPLDATWGVTDQSGNARNGTGNGGITIGGNASKPTALVGTSTDFDGSDDYIQSSYNPFVNGSTRTYTGWIYLDTLASGKVVVTSNAASDNDKPALQLVSDGRALWFPEVATGNIQVADAGSFTTGTWIHWALIFNESSNAVEMYVNGTSEGATTKSDGHDASPGNLRLSGFGGQFVDGKMAHFAVFERALTATEISEHYNAGLVALAGTARRFVELGGSFENYVEGQQTEFRAGAAGGDLTLAIPGSASTDSVTDRIGTHTIEVNTVLPAWTTFAYLADLEQIGTHKVRARVLHEDEDVTTTVRALWRSGSGAWKELDSATIPASGWWDLPLGSISHYDSAETIDLRFDVRSSEVSTDPFRVNLVTVTPADVYVVARGQTTAGVTGGVTGFDDMGADTTTMASRSAQLGGAWTAFGSGHFVTYGDTQARFDEDASLTAGRGYILNGLSATAAQTVAVSGKAYGTEEGSQSILGAIFRYVDSSNWGLAALRVKRTAAGEYKNYVTLYKCIAGTLTNLQQKVWTETGTAATVGGAAHKSSLTGTVFVSVDPTGTYEVSVNRNVESFESAELLFTGTDSVFATSGTLDDGKMGFYGASTAVNGELYIHRFIGYSETSEVVTTDVVRADGTGELTYADAFSADADGTDKQPVSSAEGRRIWLPPNLEGLITAKVRTSDSEVEVDAGHSEATDLTVYHRPAFATLSDSLE